MCSMCRAADLNILRRGQKTSLVSWTVPSYVLTAMFYRSTVLSFASQEVVPASLQTCERPSTVDNVPGT